MKNSLKQEMFKFIHQRIPLYGGVALLVLMFYTAVSRSAISRITMVQGFGDGQWISIIMITIASTFIAMEYQNNTITTLFYKSSNTSTIYFAKLLVILIYGLLLIVLGTMLTFIFKAVLIGNQFSWMDSYHQRSLLIDFFLTQAGSFVYMLFIISLAFFLIVWIKTNAAVVGIGLAVGFLGSALSSFVMSALPGLISILKWNPLNMIHILVQLTSANDIKFSHLSNAELIIGNLAYVAAFSILGSIIFKNRHV